MRSFHCRSSGLLTQANLHDQSIPPVAAQVFEMLIGISAAKVSLAVAIYRRPSTPLVERLPERAGQ